MNRKLLAFLFLAVFATVSIFSCKKADDNAEVPDMTGNYFPLQKGKYIIYNVDSTIWEESTCTKQIRKYQMMYKVADTFRDATGRLSYRIDRSIRKLIEDPWIQHDVLYVTKTNTTLEWSQDNLHFIKMVYPIERFKTWKGNGYIQSADTPYAYFADWDYRYEDVGKPFDAGEITYDNTVIINQVDIAENNPETMPRYNASRTFGKEVYSEGLGLVYREYYHWTYNPNAFVNQDTFQVSRCRLGTGVVMRAVDHN